MAKVMICDDAAFMRMMIKDILTKNGYEIAAEAENGQKAVCGLISINFSVPLSAPCYALCYFFSLCLP